MIPSDLPASLPPNLSGRPLHHVAIAVPSIEAARTLYARLSGVDGTPVEAVPSQGVNVAFFGSVELLEPSHETSNLQRFLDRRGPGLHHIAWEVEDLTAELTALEADGFELLDKEPRMGAGGHRIAFIHPRSCGGVLVELVERAH